MASLPYGFIDCNLRSTDRLRSDSGHKIPGFEYTCKPSQRYWLCPLCGDPGDIEVKCLECGSPAKICACCVSKEVEPLSSFDKDALNSESFRPTKKLAVGGKFCSKNCRYHYQRKLAQ